MREFNVNDYVHVRLSERGRSAHYNHYANHGCDAPPIKEDENGWSKWQLWVLFEVFGEHIYNGAEPPFETTIRIEENQ